MLGLDVAAAQSEEFLRLASGTGLMVGSQPLAHRYGGHQVSSGVKERSFSGNTSLTSCPPVPVWLLGGSAGGWTSTHSGPVHQQVRRLVCVFEEPHTAEALNPHRTGEVWELQLKGSGKTPYSRFDPCVCVCVFCLPLFILPILSAGQETVEPSSAHP